MMVWMHTRRRRDKADEIRMFVWVGAVTGIDWDDNQCLYRTTGVVEPTGYVCKKKAIITYGRMMEMKQPGRR